MGDEAYFGFLGEYARRFGMQIVTADDFLALLREFSPVDLQPVLDEYFKTS
jgi:hypothetical protein